MTSTQLSHPPTRLRRLHRLSASVLIVFALAHLSNHLDSMAGIGAHIAFMDAARSVYRQPLVEIVLLACVAFQVGTGLWLLVSGWRRRRGGIAWLQAASGALLAFFLLAHVGAVLAGRAIFQLDTNFYFAAAGFHVPPFAWFFAPYYFLAVVALFTHLGCAAYWYLAGTDARKAKRALHAMIGIGVVVSLLIVLSLAGLLHGFVLPSEYRVPYLGQTH